MAEYTRISDNEVERTESHTTILDADRQLEELQRTREDMLFLRDRALNIIDEMKLIHQTLPYPTVIVNKVLAFEAQIR